MEIFELSVIWTYLSDLTYFTIGWATAILTAHTLMMYYKSLHTVSNYLNLINGAVCWGYEY